MLKLLLDTHVLLWWLEDPKLLSNEAKTAIADGNNQVFVSAAVVWELTIKKSLGKIEMPNNFEHVLQVNQFSQLPINIAHTMAVQVLPHHHRDPFDRILIAQAICEDMCLVTRDPNILKYGASCILA